MGLPQGFAIHQMRITANENERGFIFSWHGNKENVNVLSAGDFSLCLVLSPRKITKP
jgi:hypothetical protein